MGNTTVSRLNVVRMLAECRPADEKSLKSLPSEGPPLSGELVAHLLSVALGSPAGWRNLTAVRPNLASRDRTDLPGLLAHLFAEEAHDG